MSQLNANVRTSYYNVRKWLGVNESPDGDTGLKAGEAAKMRNFRITDGGALRKRPGMKNVIGLGGEYVLSFGEEETVLEELNTPKSEFTMYPKCDASSNGALQLAGDPVSVTFDQGSAAANYFFENDGVLYSFVGTSTAPEEGTPSDAQPVPGGYISYGKRTTTGHYQTLSLTYYPSFSVANGEVVFEGAGTEIDWHDSRDHKFSTPVYAINPLTGKPARIYAVENNGFYDSDIQQTYTAGIDFEAMTPYDVRYIWRARKVEARAADDSVNIRALWSGYVAEDKVLVAACSGTLWRLEEENGTWSSSAIGYVNTDGAVSMFGMNNKLYVLDGVSYYVWNGVTFGEVPGYIPTVVTATAPGGGGQQLQQVNKLTLKRRQLFSADGSATIYQLAEKELASIDRVTVDGVSTTANTNTADGTITFASAPKEGQNNVEVYYTASLVHAHSFTGNGSTSAFTLPVGAEDFEKVVSVTVGGTATNDYSLQGDVLSLGTAPASGAAVVVTLEYKDPRLDVLGMRYAEFFNGSNDNRVFIYGNGTNEAFYSGVDMNGKGTAEYFPDLNEVAFGDNSPLTAMSRHYNRLLAFKEDSTYSVYYDAVTLADGTLTAGFYVSAVNKDIGNVANGQARLVENRVRTLDGKSIYEWRGTNTSGNVTNDQRNANRISQKVESTLKDFDFANAVCFFDKIRHEYYCISGDIAIVQNTENEAWYVYTNFPATAVVLHDDEMYVGTADGWVRHISEAYANDNGEAIAAYWESGSLSFDRDYIRKYSPTVWVSMMGDASELQVGMFDDGGNADEASVIHDGGDIAKTYKKRLKAWRFSHYKLTFAENSTKSSAALQTATVEVKYNADVKRR